MGARQQCVIFGKTESGPLFSKKKEEVAETLKLFLGRGKLVFMVHKLL